MVTSHVDGDGISAATNASARESCATTTDPTIPNGVGLRDTIHHLVANAGGRLRAAGVDSPRVDAELLMAHALTVTANGAKPAPAGDCAGCLPSSELPGHLPDLRVPVSRSSLFLRRNEVVPASTAEYFTACVDRRVVREPLQYIMGQATFCGVTLAVGPGAFIPRPETELMVEWVWSTLRHRVVAALSSFVSGSDSATPAPVVMVDFCSGPGTIALGLAAQVFDLARSMAMSRSMTTRMTSGAPSDSSEENAASTSDQATAGSGGDSVHTSAVTPRVIIIGVEKSDEALAYARQNVEALRNSIAATVAEDNLPADLAHAVAVQVIQGDVTDAATIAQVHEAVVGLGYEAPAEHFADVVLSNPPYVPASALVSPEVRADPAQAVFGGVDGMSVITPMVPTMLALAKPGALLAIEHDDATGPEVAAVLSDAGAASVHNHQDLAGRDRFATAEAPE